MMAEAVNVTLAESHKREMRHKERIAKHSLATIVLIGAPADFCELEFLAFKKFGIHLDIIAETLNAVIRTAVRLFRSVTVPNDV